MNKPQKMDYHMHSNHSMDGKQSMDEACKRAIELGLDEICFTDHIEPHHPTEGVDKPPVFPNWLKDIENVKGKYPSLVIKKGIEIGDNAPYRQEIWALLDSIPLDFRLLSLHLIENMDPYDQVYFEGKTQKEAYEKYAQARLESIKNFKDYDAIAHLGYVCKFAPYPTETRPMKWNHAPDVLDELLKHLAQEGKALEINASGLRETDSPIPGGDIVKRFVELGGVFFTFGSDAHHGVQIYQHVDKAKEIAIANGAKWEVGYTQRKMEVYPLL